MKVLPTKVHGVLDYLTGLTLIAIPHLLGWSGRPASLVTFFGITTLIYSLLTYYELGLVKLIPMSGHLILDFLSGLTLLVSPFFLHVSSRIETVLIVIGVFEIVVAMITKERTSLPSDTHRAGTHPSSHVQPG